MNKTNKEKGIFLQEFYGVKEIPPLKNQDGKPSKFAEAAKYWGEAIPTNSSEVKQLVALGASLLNKAESKNLTEVKLSNSLYSGTQNLSLLKPNLIKVPFVKKGSWNHDVYGKVEFTDKDIEELITNYKNNVTGFTPYLTLGHLDEELNSTDSHRKRGDLNDIIVEGDTTFGVFEVNDEIYDRVQKGEYEYSSGEFHRKFKDRETGNEVGTTILRVALTNSPFLPFGNDKIQTLSNEAESCPETKENFVFLLSLDTSNSDTKAKDKTEAEQSVEPLLTETQEITELNPDVEVEPILQNTLIENITLLNKESIMSTENNVAETKEVILEAKNEAPTEVATPVVLETTEAVVQKEIKVEAPQNQGDVILTNLTTQLQKVQDMYSKQLEAAHTTINALTQKVDALTDKLTGQEQVTQAFSNSMSAAQERSMIQNLQNNGVLPTNIQRFVALKNAFQSADNKNIVKFSVGTGTEVKEVETNLIDAVAELLISASNQTPLVEQQLGVSAGRRTGGFDFSSIIEKNQAAAQKLNSK